MLKKGLKIFFFLFKSNQLLEIFERCATLKKAILSSLVIFRGYTISLRVKNASFSLSFFLYLKKEINYLLVKRESNMICQKKRKRSNGIFFCSIDLNFWDESNFSDSESHSKALNIFGLIFKWISNKKLIHILI